MPADPQTPAPDIAAELFRINSAITRIERVINLMLVHRPTREEQAKMAGISRQALWLRERRERNHQLIKAPARTFKKI